MTCCIFCRGDSFLSNSKKYDDPVEQLDKSDPPSDGRFNNFRSRCISSLAWSSSIVKSDCLNLFLIKFFSNI